MTVTSSPSRPAATPPASGAPTQHTTSRPPAPRPSTHAPQDAPRTVGAYFSAIDAHDYRAAWDLGGKNLGGSHASFVQGFAGTARDTLRITGSSGDTVSITLDARQTDGSVSSYAGTYTVRDGVVVGASVHAVGGPQPSRPARGGRYENCSQAHDDVRYDIPRGDPAYAPHLDRDQDGRACEAHESPTP
ncbi:excalibur calcium-binding domain-containing protein [Streptomyces sp. V4-01]|uniref:Excalibur calcium-binding domain-containing protein n=1 Tax=Actinacidiphila polyblastidii TaxID=3110430 RepID=A0ABU7PGP5_9ACTN|nr:excalibur calcium-binding domain-containing protein [Streptomyces sp. V4-01]